MIKRIFGAYWLSVSEPFVRHSGPVRIERAIRIQHSGKSSLALLRSDNERGMRRFRGCFIADDHTFIIIIKRPQPVI